MKDILIVEDGQGERDRLLNLFKQKGYSVVACATVGEAEHALQIDAFQIALLDIGLSDRSGSYLFNAIKRGGRVSHILIFTGNPSVHLKERFLDEGASDYIVKGSPAAESEQMLRRVEELIGGAQPPAVEGMPLQEFLTRCVGEKSRKLFLEGDGSLPRCGKCHAADYRVTFLQQAQVPPQVQGLVVCAGCGAPMDLEVG